MKRTSKTFIAILMGVYSLILIFGIAIGFEVVNSYASEEALNNEFVEIEYLINTRGLADEAIDFKLDNYVTDGNYLDVEIAIKSYLRDLLKECRRLDTLNNDEELNRVLYLENFDEDAPHFTYSLKVIADAKKEVEEIGNNLTNLFDNYTIMSYANNYNLDWYYLDYYQELMIDEDMLSQNSTDIVNNLDYIQSMFDVYTEFFTFLSDNYLYWTMDEEYIYFDTDELLEEYNRLLTIINNLDFSYSVEEYI